MMKNLVSLFLTALALTSLLACDAKVSSDQEDPPQKPNNGFEHKVSGPGLDGTWLSSCQLDRMSSGSYKLTYVIRGQSIQWTKDTYVDASCKTTLEQKRLEGEFRFNKSYPNEVFEVEYHFAVNGGYVTTYENIRLNGRSLFVDPFMIGEGVIPRTELTQATAQPAPTPAPPVESDPADVVGIPARSWSEVKYVFCETQGFASLMDFRGLNLQTVKSGQLDWGVRECNRREAFQWSKNISFSVSGSEADFKMLVGTNGSYIEDNGFGLQRAWTVLGGNSGLCYFLANKGTKNVSLDCR